MLISFFEEFPTVKNLAKLKLVRWPTKLYIAAPSFRELERIRTKLQHHRQIREVIYWPILQMREGYWISPFSRQQALQRIFTELHGRKIPVMLDLELPTTKNPWLYLLEARHFCQNKQLIQHFINRYQGRITVAEYYPERRWQERIMKSVGLHYPLAKIAIIKMLYTSVHHFKRSFLQQELQRGKQEYGEQFKIALGTIAKGINGQEPILSAAALRKDLEIMQQANVHEVIIYRLGGLNKWYTAVLHQFSKRG